MQIMKIKLDASICSSIFLFKEAICVQICDKNEPNTTPQQFDIE